MEISALSLRDKSGVSVVVRAAHGLMRPSLRLLTELDPQKPPKIKIIQHEEMFFPTNKTQRVCLPPQFSAASSENRLTGAEKLLLVEEISRKAAVTAVFGFPFYFFIRVESLAEQLLFRIGLVGMDSSTNHLASFSSPRSLLQTPSVGSSPGGYTAGNTMRRSGQRQLLFDE